VRNSVLRSILQLNSKLVEKVSARTGICRETARIGSGTQRDEIVKASADRDTERGPTVP